MRKGDLCWPGLWASLACLFLVCAFAIYGGHPRSASAIEGRVRSAVEEKLARAELNWVRVQVLGQKAVLTGDAPSPDEKERAAKVVKEALGKGGLIFGGVTRVDDRVRVAPAASPFDWGAVILGPGRVRLIGHAPSEDVRQALIAVAKRSFPNEVDDRMRVAAGAPALSDWPKVTRDALSRLAQLSGGEARLIDTALSLRGEGPAIAISEIKAAYAAPLAAPFTAALDLVVEAPAPVIPEIAGVNLGPDARKDDCQDAFSRIMAKNVINFETGSARVRRDSRPLLDNLAFVARRCSRFKIEVAGHTDNQGQRESNLTLSRQRAEAVVDYLSRKGVGKEQMSAIGFGPDKPAADNSSALGRSKNRRIEFTVSE